MIATAGKSLNELTAEVLESSPRGEIPRGVTAKVVYAAVVKHLEDCPNYCPEMDSRLALLRDALRHQSSFAKPRRWRPSPDMLATAQVCLGRWDEIKD